MRKAHPTDSIAGEGSSGEGEEGSSGEGEEGSSGEGEEGKSEEIEMEGPLVHVVAEDNETHEEDGATVEEKDDYFQDPTSICKIYTGNNVSTNYTFSVSLAPLIDPIPTQRFPEYVRDMLYGGEENKLKV